MITFRPVDLPFLATVVGGSAPGVPLEDWESYQVGSAGTQSLDQGIGFAGSWAAVSNYFGISGEETWDYPVAGNAGTITLDGGFGFSGSWSLIPSSVEVVGTENWNDYVLASYGSGGQQPSSVLNGGFGFSGTWHAEADRVNALGGYDDWSAYSVGDAGTQVLSAGTGFESIWTS